MFTFFALLIVALAAFYLLKTAEVNKGRKLANEKYTQTKVEKFENTHALKKLSILPLIDLESISENLKTENGVSYLIQTDEKQILLDLGFNKGKENPSPLLHNMSVLGKSFDEIDFLVFSHIHLTTLAGWQNKRQENSAFLKQNLKHPIYRFIRPINYSLQNSIHS